MNGAFQPGDRLPNFLVRDAQGVSTAVHTHHLGRPMLLLALTGEGEWPAEVLDALVASQHLGEPLLLAAGARLAAALARGGDLPVLEAPAPLLAALAEDAPTRWALLLLDADLRLLLRASEPAAVRQLLREVPQRLPAPTPVLTLPRLAPVLHVPAVLEPALCAEAIAYLRERCGGGDPSGVVDIEAGQPRFRLAPEIKMRRETAVEDPALEARLHERIERRVLPEIRRAFHFAVARREPFKVISYAAGAGYFRAHRDNESRDTAHRRFAMTLNLNTGEYQGGQLRFPEFGPHLHQAEAGAALVFSCSLLHEATDITTGTRVAMTTFFSGAG